MIVSRVFVYVLFFALKADNCGGLSSKYVRLGFLGIFSIWRSSSADRYLEFLSLDLLINVFLMAIEIRQVKLKCWIWCNSRTVIAFDRLGSWWSRPLVSKLPGKKVTKGKKKGLRFFARETLATVSLFKLERQFRHSNSNERKHLWPWPWLFAATRCNCGGGGPVRHCRDKILIFVIFLPIFLPPRSALHFLT